VAVDVAAPAMDVAVEAGATVVGVVVTASLLPSVQEAVRATKPTIMASRLSRMFVR